MAVFFLVNTWGLLGCLKTDRSSSSSDKSESENSPVQEVLGGYFEYSKRGKVIQSLSATKMTRWAQSNGPAESSVDWKVDDGFTLYIGGSKSSHNASLSARRGTYNEKSSQLEAWGEVVLINEVGDKLLTEHLIWSHDSDMVKTNDAVEIFTKEGVLRGQGLTADSQFERYEILKPSGSFDLGITSDGANASPTP